MEAVMEIKPPTTYEEQLEMLTSRGVEIQDADMGQCKKVLEDINYYRLTAYFLPFKLTDGNYAAGTSFLRVYRIYEFDRKLRRILFTALEDVEISLRAKFAYYHAHRYGATGYLNPASFSDKHNHVKFLENFNREVNYNQKAPFVKHHLEKYDGIFPIWVACELFSFGMLSFFYADMQTQDRKYLSKRVYNTTEKNVTSWLRCCSDLRNICAHYGRLYFRVFTASPAGFSQQYSPETLFRLWGAVLALKGLYPDIGKWNSEVLPAISALFEEYAGEISLSHIAFPENWIDILHK